MCINLKLFAIGLNAIAGFPYSTLQAGIMI